MLTRVFKSGNSIAVRIPSELAFLEPATDVEIERVGDSLVLRPVSQKTLADLPAILSAFSPEFMAQGRELHEQKERDWLQDDAAQDSGRKTRKSDATGSAPRDQKGSP
jgi:antitoxin VapB